VGHESGYILEGEGRPGERPDGNDVPERMERPRVRAVVAAGPAAVVATSRIGTAVTIVTEIRRRGARRCGSPFFLLSI
jgi:hypothetical protein